jgi:hypothetical protein
LILADETILSSMSLHLFVYTQVACQFQAQLCSDCAANFDGTYFNTAASSSFSSSYSIVAVFVVEKSAKYKPHQS